MKKGIIITGPQASGKTTKAREIASQFPKENVVWLFARDKRHYSSPFAFSDCTENTQLIIVEEIMKARDVEFFFNCISEGVWVNKRGKNPFIINPQIVLVCQSEIIKNQLPEGASFTHRFDVVECCYEAV
jgi:hypothetical protein